MLQRITFTETTSGITQEWVFRVDHGARTRNKEKSGVAWLERLEQQGETYRSSLEDVPKKYKEALKSMGYEVQEK